VSPTFHGRDVFAPVAGALSLGTLPSELGPRVTDFVRLPFAAPFQRYASTLVGTVIHVDRFGNCITNVTPRDLDESAIARGARLLVEGREISSFRRFFADEGGAEGEPFAVWGSAGLLEIAVFRDSAARALGLVRGSEFEVVFARAS
jgi:S-adenosylmethionine hydrolase